MIDSDRIIPNTIGVHLVLKFIEWQKIFHSIHKQFIHQKIGILNTQRE